MAVLGTNTLGLVDIAKMKDPDGGIAKVAEVLEQTNELIPDIPWHEGNKDTGHQSVLRLSLPTPTLRRLNEGVGSTKSTTQPQTDTIAQIEAWSTLDVDTPAGGAGNLAQVRFNESIAHMEAIAQEGARLFVYGDPAADDREFKGFFPRYTDPSSSTLGDNIFDAGGAGSGNTSILLVNWGPNTVFGIYPKGSTAGIYHEDHGVVTDNTSTTTGGTKLRVYEERFVWKCGLVVKNPFDVVRIGSIDVSALIALTGTQATTASTSIVRQMARATYRLQSRGRMTSKPCFYAPRIVLETLQDIASTKTASGQLRTDLIEGVPVTTINGIPIKTLDAISVNETAI